MYLDDFPAVDVGSIQTQGRLFVDGRWVEVHQHPLSESGFYCYYLDEKGNRRRKVFRASNVWVSWQWLTDRDYKYKSHRLCARKRKKHAAEKLEKRY
jgi:hypothetical protein